MTRRRASGTSIRRLLTAAAVLLAICASTTACFRFPAPESPPPVAFGVNPTPPGAESQVAREPVPNSQNCDATVSLRPGPLPPPNRMPRGSTMAEIQERGRLIVGLDIGSNLFSFRDPISGDIQGFDVDIARAVARGIFGNPATIEFRVLSSADRTQALVDGSVDIVVKTMSITCDRLQEVSFSTPYYVAYQRILSTRNSGVNGPAGLANKRVCAARGTTSIGRLQAIAPRVRMVTTTTWADCLVLMQQGQADAVSTDDAILAGLAEQDPWVQLVGPSLGAEFYGVGIPRGRDDMVRFVNGVLDRLRLTGEWQQMYNRWLSILGPGTGPPQPVYRD
ncbi:glutamate ABC transporter substrate-binding protein [Gordonia sp. LSe1-13]|uniref:Glutamate ABC transporter substrate-binding protein n=1 Tax=Gordonia sesuvii TaxID=3116777 RepID=A0ABU7MFC7_9ACTN|nr:glutamate ABC transporter substrate-binding protein [Gordonia sp. LSe1-13]